MIMLFKLITILEQWNKFYLFYYCTCKNLKILSICFQKKDKQNIILFRIKNKNRKKYFTYFIFFNKNIQMEKS